MHATLSPKDTSIMTMLSLKKFKDHFLVRICEYLKTFFFSQITTNTPEAENKEIEISSLHSDAVLRGKDRTPVMEWLMVVTQWTVIICLHGSESDLPQKTEQVS